MGQILCKYVCAADKYSEFAFRLYAYKLELKRIRLFFDSNSYEHKVEVIQFIFLYRGYVNPFVLCDSNTCLAVFYRKICGRIFTKLPYKDIEKHMTATYGRLSHSRHAAP